MIKCTGKSYFIELNNIMTLGVDTEFCESCYWITVHDLGYYTLHNYLVMRLRGFVFTPHTGEMTLFYM
jgi:hypothetical protein